MTDDSMIIGGLIMFCLGVIGLYYLMDAACEEVPPPLCILLAGIWPIAVPLFGYVLISKSIMAVLKGDR